MVFDLNTDYLVTSCAAMDILQVTWLLIFFYVCHLQLINYISKVGESQWHIDTWTSKEDKTCCLNTILIAMIVNGPFRSNKWPV